jgi:hypothetical protein
MAEDAVHDLSRHLIKYTQAEEWKLQMMKLKGERSQCHGKSDVKSRFPRAEATIGLTHSSAKRRLIIMQTSFPQFQRRKNGPLHPHFLTRVLYK